jgi:hypothetical protein
MIKLTGRYLAAIALLIGFSCPWLLLLPAMVQNDLRYNVWAVIPIGAIEPIGDLVDFGCCLLAV